MQVFTQPALTQSNNRSQSREASTQTSSSKSYQNQESMLKFVRKSGEKVKKNEKTSDTKTSQNKEQITSMLDAQKKPSKLDSKPPTNKELLRHWP